ncbi:hypothetical protein ACO1O0_003120 [Amphichorda felina]
MSETVLSVADDPVRLQIPGRKPPLSLLDIPLELRLEIYRELLLAGDYIPIYSIEDHLFFLITGSDDDNGPEDVWPQILATCSQINREGTPILYGENKYLADRYADGDHDYLEGRLFLPFPLLNQHHIADVRLSYGYNSNPENAFDWDGELWAMRAFPSLKTLVVHFHIGGYSRFDTEEVWLRVMRSADRKLLPPKRLQCDLGISMADKDHQEWFQSRKRKLGFSLHEKKKAHCQDMMEREGLFRDRRIAWDFYIHAWSWMTQPGCSIHFTVGDATVAGQDWKNQAVRCWTVGEDDTLEEAVDSEETAESEEAVEPEEAVASEETVD